MWSGWTAGWGGRSEVTDSDRATVQVRLATYDDAASIAVLLRQLMIDHGLTPATLPDLRRAAETIFATERAWYLVAVTGAEVIGALQLNERFSTWLGATYCYVEDFCVAPRWRGRGVGGQLLDEVAIWARQRQWARVDLDVSTSLPASVRFYQRHGYRDTGSVLLRREYTARDNPSPDAPSTRPGAG